MDNSGESYSGYFLIASSALMDPNFNETVVFILHHDEQGAFGVIVNRPISEKLPPPLDKLSDMPVQLSFFEGGPVQTNTVLLLHDNPAISDQSIIENVYKCL